MAHFKLNSNVFFNLFFILFAFVKDIYSQRYLIVSMARRQIQTQVIGSFLGIFWTFINPLVLIFIFWFVFSVGFKTKPLGDIPFAAWLTAGIAIWIAFNEIVLGSSNIIIENQALIKKTRIQAYVLPISKIIASLIPHSVFIVILITMIFLYKLSLSFYFIQFLYYFFSMCIMALGLGWLFAALNVFIRDTVPMVNVSMQLLFWFTPIMWDINIMPQEYHKFIKLNPIFYIVQGYRDSFFYAIPFWHNFGLTIYYWTIALIIFTIGGVIFKKTRPHFADIL